MESIWNPCCSGHRTRHTCNLWDNSANDPNSTRLSPVDNSRIGLIPVGNKSSCSGIAKSRLGKQCLLVYLSWELRLAFWTRAVTRGRLCCSDHLSHHTCNREDSLWEHEWEWKSIYFSNIRKFLSYLNLYLSFIFINLAHLTWKFKRIFMIIHSWKCSLKEMERNIEFAEISVRIRMSSDE
jgi:hypothetical protein